MQGPANYSNSIHEQLTQLARDNGKQDLLDKFAQDPDRVSRFNFDLGAFSLDLSKTHIDSDLLDRYCELANDINFVEKRQQFLAGKHINETEDRPVLHTLLRQKQTQFSPLLDPQIVEQAIESRVSFKAQIAHIRKRIENSDGAITDLIHVGIGGSSLGTQLVYEALKPLDCALRVHFVSNIDAHQLIDVLAQCSPKSTLLFGISKTFTTAETLLNVRSVLAWMSQHGVEQPMDNLYAVTASPESAYEFGVVKERVVTFPEWVGGRYSVWSSVSISAALVLGETQFEEFLQGAALIDKHFEEADPASNVPYLAACMDHYYGNYVGTMSRGIFAYDHRLRSLVAYLQQLETESNGKDRQKNGDLVDQHTSPVIWGGVGTDVQHSVFQMLHQGTSIIPSEFILVLKPDHDLDHHHATLLANGIAQTAALLQGQNTDEILENEPEVSGNDLLTNSKIFAGNRPSSTYLLERLDPYALGGLLAFFEHRTFCFGQLVNINSFDQMGVELGKRLANDVSSCLVGNGDSTSFDPSTQALIKLIKPVLNQQN